MSYLKYSLALIPANSNVVNITEMLLEIAVILGSVVAMRTIPPNDIYTVNMHLVLSQVPQTPDGVATTVNATSIPFTLFLIDAVAVCLLIAPLQTFSGIWNNNAALNIRRKRILVAVISVVDTPVLAYSTLLACPADTVVHEVWMTTRLTMWWVLWDRLRGID